MSREHETKEPAVRSATLKAGVSRVTLFGLPHSSRHRPRRSSARWAAGTSILTTSSPQRPGRAATWSCLSRLIRFRRTWPWRWPRPSPSAIRRPRSRCRETWRACASSVWACASHSGVAAKVFGVIAAEGVNVENIATSEIVISVLMAEEKSRGSARCTPYARRSTWNMSRWRTRVAEEHTPAPPRRVSSG